MVVQIVAKAGEHSDGLVLMMPRQVPGFLQLKNMGARVLNMYLYDNSSCVNFFYYRFILKYKYTPILLIPTITELDYIIPPSIHNCNSLNKYLYLLYMARKCDYLAHHSEGKEACHCVRRFQSVFGEFSWNIL